MLFLSQSGIIQLMKTKILVWGKVKMGSKRGKSLGFPTINIDLHKNIADGVYLSKVKIGKHVFSSLTFVGAAKTFAEKDKKVESYILNFNKNVYDKWITIRLFEKIRGNIKFKSKEELINQMKKDVTVANKFFQNNR
jgi:riboflavin kinase/FMN adenylyltransferase